MDCYGNFRGAWIAMDKENGETSESGTGSSKLSNPPDPASLLDAANLFGGKFIYHSAER